MLETSLTLYSNNALKSDSTRKTVICGGSPRGGTSMVAGTIHGMGIPMGGDDLPQNIEDQVFNPDSYRVQHGKFDRTIFLNQVREHIKVRNGNNDMWGWKYPLVFQYLEEVISDLHNPHLVLVLRDPIPGTMRESKGISDNDPQHDEIILKKVEVRFKMMQNNFELAQKLQIPTLLVSYERAIQRKEKFLSELSSFLQQDLPEDLTALLDFMEPGTYKSPIAK